MRRVGVIKGSGFEGLFVDESVSGRCSTPYGEVEVYRAEINGVEVIHIPRHGLRHETLPHEIEYRGIIYAMKGCRGIIAISTVGGISPGFTPGMIVLPDQYIDLCQDVWTFSSGVKAHVDMSMPFCREIRSAISRHGRVHEGGTYARMRGPGFETVAEVRMLRTLGADIVGMTVAPEARLAREVNICYQPITLVTNTAGGVVSHEKNLLMVKKRRKKIETIIRDTLPEVVRIDKHDH